MQAVEDLCLHKMASSLYQRLQKVSSPTSWMLNHHFVADMAEVPDWKAGLSLAWVAQGPGAIK